MVSPTTPTIPGHFGWNARRISKRVTIQRYNGGERAVRKSSSAGLPVVKTGVTLGRFSLTAITVPTLALTKDKMEVTIRPIFALSFGCDLLICMFAPSFLL